MLRIGIGIVLLLIAGVEAQYPAGGAVPSVAVAACSEITFEAAGFARPARQGVTVLVGHTARELRIGERVRLDTIAEAFRFSGLTPRADPAFLEETATGNTLYRERKMQFAARLRFRNHA